MDHVSDVLETMLAELRANRDNEILMAGEVAGQYVQDHNDKEAFRRIEKEVNHLAKSWDRMISLLEKTAEKASKIESSCENFYGD